jgi:hypothetical protein
MLIDYNLKPFVMWESPYGKGYLIQTRMDSDGWEFDGWAYRSPNLIDDFVVYEDDPSWVHQIGHRMLGKIWNCDEES